MTGLHIIAGLTIIPLIICSFYVHSRVKRLFQEYSGKPVKRGMTGRHIARAMLDSAGLQGVVVEEMNADLLDHYDPRQKVVRLSRNVSRKASIAAVGIAAHEAAHAIQDGTGYPPIKLRNRIAPFVKGGGYLILPLLFLGLLLSSMAQSSFLIDLALLLLFVTVLFYLVTLPVELEASSRAMRYIEDSGISDDQELDGVRKVLRAAALTYLVAAALAITQFLRVLGIYRRNER
ncbi:unnamed protein product, partial [marine sediment metagenome]